MAQLARAAKNDPEFRNVAQGLGSMAGVDHFIRDHFRYRDEAEEIVRTPEFMMNDLTRLGWIEGDCDDVSTLYAGFADTLGIPSRFVAIRYRPSNPNFEHVFTEALQGGQWQTFDATVPLGTPINSIEEMTEDI